MPERLTGKDRRIGESSAFAYQAMRPMAGLNMYNIIRHSRCARRLKPRATVTKPACAGYNGFDS